MVVDVCANNARDADDEDPVENGEEDAVNEEVEYADDADIEEGIDEDDAEEEEEEQEEEDAEK